MVCFCIIFLRASLCIFFVELCGIAIHTKNTLDNRPEINLHNLIKPKLQKSPMGDLGGFIQKKLYKKSKHNTGLFRQDEFSRLLQ